MQVRWYDEGCKKDGVEEDKTVGAEGISTSSARWAGMTVMVNSDKGMNNSIAVHIHLITVCPPAIRKLSIDFCIYSKPVPPSNDCRCFKFLVIRRVLVCNVSHESFTSPEFHQVK